MAEYSLIPHPDFPSVAVTDIRVEVWRSGSDLDLRFWLRGDLMSIRWPARVSHPERTDNLWKETCFEAFIELRGQPGYREINVSPSGNWAAYTFDAYREGMGKLENPDGRQFAGYGPGFDQGDEFAIDVVAGEFDPDVDWRLGVSVVMEALDGTKSYWALAHAPGPPDFHNPDCFIATLPAPDAP